MSASLQYEGNGQYSVYLESGYTTISKEEIYDLVREIAKHEPIPTFVEDFEYNKCWSKSIMGISDVVGSIIYSSKEPETQLKKTEDIVEDIIDETICNAQNVASEFYKDNYIIIEK